MRLYRHDTPENGPVLVRRMVVARAAELITVFCTQCAEEMNTRQVACYQRNTAVGEVVGISSKRQGETMTGEETAATTWQDPNSGPRRHKLMTKEIGDTIPALYANEQVEDYDSVLAHAKLFSPLYRLDAGM